MLERVPVKTNQWPPDVVKTKMVEPAVELLGGVRMESVNTTIYNPVMPKVAANGRWK